MHLHFDLLQFAIFALPANAVEQGARRLSSSGSFAAAIS